MAINIVVYVSATTWFVNPGRYCPRSFTEEVELSIQAHSLPPLSKSTKMLKQALIVTCFLERPEAGATKASGG